MNKFVVGLVFMMVLLAAWASCTTHSYFYNGKMVYCTTCCVNNNCQTTCI